MYRLLLAVLVPAVLAVTPGFAAAATTTLSPAADTFVDIAAPSTNYQSASLLNVYGVTGSDINGARALYRFNGVPASAQSVKLRVYATVASSEPLGVYEILQGCNWDNATVTWQNRPDRKALLAQIPSVVAGWNEITLPVSSLPAAGGSACFYVSKLGTQVVKLQALNNANPTQLVVDTAPTPTPTPTPDPAPTGRAFYISPSGNDSNACTLSAPCRTWMRADNLLTQPGDTLYARGGTYTGQTGSWQAVSGTSSAPVTFRNYPGETPIFDGGGAQTVFMSISGGRDYTTFQGLTVQNYKGQHAFWVGYSGSGTNYAVGNTFRGNTFRNMGDDVNREHAIYCSYGNVDLTVEGNRFFNTSGAAIHCYHGPGVQRATIRNNLIVGANWGVLFADGARDISIYNNTIVNTTLEGIRVRPSGQGETGDTHIYNPIVRNNILVNSGNGAACGAIGSCNATNPQVSHNLYRQSPVNALDTARLTSDPLFVNPATGDYHLQAGSPAVDSGTAVGAPLMDMDGVARYKGAGYDRGAYER